MTSTILTAVERQLTRYFSAMSQQAETARQLAEQSRDEIRRELDARLPALEEAVRELPTGGPAPVDEAQLARLSELESALHRINERAEEQRSANDSYQAALQTALEERLGEFANHQHWRMNDIEDKIAALPTGIDPESMIEIRQTVRDDMERSFGSVHARLDEIVNVNKRFDEQAAAHVQHVDEVTSALALRMDEGDQRTAQAFGERLNAWQEELTTTFEGVADQVTDNSTMLLGKIEQTESRGVDRLLELEGRIAEDLGTKIANLDATIGRVAGGFDDAMIALNQRLLELENKLYDFDDRMGELAERVAKFDETTINELRSEMSSAVGEAMLVRIELDRVVAATDVKIDKQTIRMTEIESLLDDHMDVSTSVQLERLDELERQIALIEPPQHVPGVARAAAAEAEAGEHAHAASNRTPPSMSLNPRVNTTDTPSADGSTMGSGADGTQDSNDDGTRETESTYSTH
ncbi:MAG: hypothetical protein JWN99_3384 [Ilumatobacteraceae bacterium]|nr:hypothetical protein [Ilumatobacteraceae bacterium]